MIVHPRFYSHADLDRANERQRFGLLPAMPTALVMFGGYGSARMIEIARRLRLTRTPCQAVFVCGRNQALVERLRRSKLPYPHRVEGFTAEIEHWMRLSDVFIGKPGPGSVSEAIAAGLPVIVEQGAGTMPQERHTVDWIVEKQTGVVVPSFGAVARAMDHLLRPDVAELISANIRAVNNRAIFEALDILERIMAEPPGSLEMPNAVAV
jgi:1,2-diacylglycerol 3-beta-galactosyltransferase